MAKWAAAIYKTPALLEAAIEAIDNTVTIHVIVLGTGDYLLIQAS